MNASGYSIPVLHNAVGIMTPFLLAGLGGLFTELAGMLNIALEGLILLGAFASVAFASATGSLLWGILLGILSSMVLAYIFGFISLYLKANIFITGLATNLFALGFTVVLAHQIYGHKGVVPFKLPTLPVISIPFLQKIPLLGDLFLGHDIIVYISWIIVIITAIVIYKTPFG
ncbi:MAG: ABC transporter permease, partial [Spirochaetes bacterium]